MRRIRLILQYEGTRYVGWQVQPNGLSIQAVLEREIEKLSGEHPTLFASGRTDSGVHALAQTAHFDTASRIPPEKWCFALNTGLPRDIRVLYSGEAPRDFHTRFDVWKKHYRYTLEYAPHASVFTRNTAFHVHGVLELAAMEQAAVAILGEHDFCAFKSAGIEPKSTLRRIYRSEWTKEGNYLHYDIAGSGFLYNMVRILVGTMLDIGAGRLPADSLERALRSGDRSDAGATAPAHGLMLSRVQYPDFDTADYVPFS